MQGSTVWVHRGCGGGGLQGPEYFRALGLEGLEAPTCAHMAGCFTVELTSRTAASLVRRSHTPPTARTTNESPGESAVSVTSAWAVTPQRLRSASPTELRRGGGTCRVLDQIIFSLDCSIDPLVSLLLSVLYLEELDCGACAEIEARRAGGRASRRAGRGWAGRGGDSTRFFPQRQDLPPQRPVHSQAQPAAWAAGPPSSACHAFTAHDSALRRHDSALSLQARGGAGSTALNAASYLPSGQGIHLLKSLQLLALSALPCPPSPPAGLTV